MADIETKGQDLSTQSLLPEVPHALTDPLPAAVIPAEAHPITPVLGHTPAVPQPAHQRRRRRVGLIALYAVVVMVIFTSGALFGYSQGPRIATWVAAGGAAAAVFQKFQPCFNDLQNSPAFRGAISLFRRPTLEPGVPTPTPQRRTLDPDAIKAVSGVLVSISPTQITLESEGEAGGTSGALRETLNFFAFHRIVTSAGREITREGLLSGDQVDVLAFRMQEGAPHVVMCVMVNVDPQ
ncbi:hypothetical protein ANRL4_00608 [Anaerolineae bacterium]|nr:hypothetical protein ANRL4_00608 [Anaerolineae bacterium]